MPHLLLHTAVHEIERRVCPAPFDASKKPKKELFWHFGGTSVLRMAKSGSGFRLVILDFSEESPFHMIYVGKRNKSNVLSSIPCRTHAFRMDPNDFCFPPATCISFVVYLQLYGCRLSLACVKSVFMVVLWCHLQLLSRPYHGSYSWELSHTLPSNFNCRLLGYLNTQMNCCW